MQNSTGQENILKESYDTKYEFSHQNKMYHLLEWHMLILFLASMKCLHHFLRIIFWVLKVNSQLLKPSISSHAKPCTTPRTELKITMKKSTEVTKNNQASEWFPKKIVKSALSILWNLQTTLLVFWYTLVAMPAPKKSLPIRPAENSAVPHAYFLCLPWSILINIDRIWWYETIEHWVS